MKFILTLIIALCQISVSFALTANELDIWNSEDFKKSFLGSYGFLPDVEPKIEDDIEREDLQYLFGLMGENDMEAAKDELLFLLEEGGPNANFYFHLGNIYFQEGKLDEAADSYNKAIDAFPSFRRAYKNLGVIYTKQSKFEQAIKAITKTVQLGEVDGATYGLLGFSYLSLKKFIPAEMAFRNAMVYQPEVKDWKLGLVRTVIGQSKYAESIALLDVMLAENPGNKQFWLLQAQAYIGSGKMEAAAEIYELVDRMGMSEPRDLSLLGDIYVNEGNMDMAAIAYQRALTSDPTQDPKGALRSAQILSARGAMDQAKKVVLAIKQNSQSSLSDDQKKELLKLESRIAVYEGEGGKAAEILEEIVAMKPIDGEALMLLGEHYNRMGQREKAVMQFERAANIEEFEADACVRQAQVMVSMGRLKEAVPLLKRAQDVKPRDSVEDYLNQVSRLAKSRK